MIKIIPNHNTGKIIRAEYENNGFKKTVELKVLGVQSMTDPNDTGLILEKYRLLPSNAEEYFKANKEKLESSVTRSSLCFQDFYPDYIICLLPMDQNRKELLEKFKNTVTSCYTSIKSDYSEKFVKKDPSKSIKKDNLTKDDFELLLDQHTPFRSLLIIDDVIDEGKTLDILLDKLVEKKIIDNQTVLKMTCIYNRPK